MSAVATLVNPAPWGQPITARFEHGQPNGYRRYGCRCEKCMAVWAEYRRNYRARLKQRPRDEVPHGTISGARDWGCKCEPCTKAKRAESERARRARGVPEAKVADEVMRRAVVVDASWSGVPVAAERSGWSASTIYKWCREAGVEPLNVRPHASHGSAGMYGKGCRCDLCRGWSRDRIVRWKEKARANVPAYVHGTANGYKNYACRCEPCKAAGAEENHRYREQMKTRAASKRAS